MWAHRYFTIYEYLWGAHVRSRNQIVISDWTLWFVTFFRVSVETHMTAHDVRVTRRMNSAIMQHSTCKSTLFATRIVPRQCETSTHKMEEVVQTFLGAILYAWRSIWKSRCSHVTLAAPERKAGVRRFKRRVGPQDSRLSYIKSFVGKLRVFL